MITFLAIAGVILYVFVMLIWQYVIDKAFGEIKDEELGEEAGVYISDETLDTL